MLLDVSVLPNKNYLTNIIYENIWWVIFLITFSFTLHNVTLILAVLILVLVNLCPVNITYITCNGGLYFGTGDQKPTEEKIFDP